jgi:hypothetical protein
LSILLDAPSQRGGEQTKEMAMSTVTKFALSAAIILSTAFSALTAANAGFAREQAVGQGGTGAACYDRDGGILSCNSR